MYTPKFAIAMHLLQYRVARHFAHKLYKESPSQKHNLDHHYNMTHLKDTKSTLVAHAHKTAESQLQNHGAFEWDKVPHILKQEKLGSVVVTVTVREESIF